jgi:hypothetical protein
VRKFSLFRKKLFESWAGGEKTFLRKTTENIYLQTNKKLKVRKKQIKTYTLEKHNH